MRCVSWGGAFGPMSLVALNSIVSRKKVSVDDILEGCFVDCLGIYFERRPKNTVDAR
jgi:hypothetical protein